MVLALAAHLAASKTTPHMRNTSHAHLPGLRWWPVAHTDEADGNNNDHGELMSIHIDLAEIA